MQRNVEKICKVVSVVYQLGVEDFQNQKIRDMLGDSGCLSSGP
jgi:hypothetical protein